MRVYISGPITGLPREEAERLFADAAAKVAARGHEPINPMLNGLPDTATWGEHMRADIRLLLDCDAIYMVGQWWESKGAMVEWQLASGLGIEQYMDW